MNDCEKKRCCATCNRDKALLTSGWVYCRYSGSTYMAHDYCDAYIPEEAPSPFPILVEDLVKLIDPNEFPEIVIQSPDRFSFYKGHAMRSATYFQEHRGMIPSAARRVVAVTKISGQLVIKTT